ncbi:hypothetical protein [Nocardioides sp. T2.26MG-1]|uniref:hypothetical protein n=1 Tax=Nocardioides sp. T2.26MG-1 TaxID=3041166 RepID=UPI002477B364|nr:hypothetical protein [Nocardioides sp. T2.26MG-1]CAI9405761.1 hypothetical protein HIDPHFAB_04448 [Nocardioides sp. T2.26MG-1]
MAAHSRLRSLVISAAAAALVAPLAIVAALASPASAAVGPRPHEVYLYKVEAQVDLSGEFPDNYAHEHLYCNDGDDALDGMWRVDHVDQANPQLDMYGDERDVVFHASYSDYNDPSMWHFRFENFADGNAQVKLFLTCIRKQTEQNAGHKHGIGFDPLYRTFSVEHVASGDTMGTVGFHGDSPAAQPCPTGFYAVAPGFNFTDVNEDHGNRLVGSWPNATGTSWQWRFLIGHDDTKVDLAFRCLSSKVLPFGGHRHLLPMKWRPNAASGGFQDNLWSNGIQEKRYSCDDGADGAAYQAYKAMVGAFWIYDPFHVWFLGMDPRPKTRAYKFWYESGSRQIALATFCVRSRTGKQIAPSA